MFCLTSENFTSATVLLITTIMRLKTRFLFFFFLVSLCTNGLIAHETGITLSYKKALLIGVSHYQDSMWNVIGSTRDLDSIQYALLKNGFKNSDVEKLTDSMATYAGVKNAFLRLLQNAKEGDVIYIHFSGHGRQLEDDIHYADADRQLAITNGDETDGFDEALVLYDAKLRIKDASDPGYLTDDEFGWWLQLLLDKVGITGQVVVSLDASHSGPDELILNANHTAPVSARGGFVEEINNQKTYATNLVLYSACLSNEISYEYDSLGTWTYAFIHALGKTREQTTGDLQTEIEHIYRAKKFNSTPTATGEMMSPLFERSGIAVPHQQFNTKNSKADFYVISIGIGNYKIKGYGNLLFNNCVSDAVGFTDVIHKQYVRYHQNDSNHYYSQVLLNENATLSGIKKAINEVINKAKKEDYFFFNFSGFTYAITDSVRKGEIIFVPFIDGDFYPGKSNSDTLGMSLKQLKDLMTFIPCKNQLLVSEAGLSGDFTRQFTKAMIETSASIQELEKRNRVIMVPRDYGKDNFMCNDQLVASGPINYYLRYYGNRNYLLNIFSDDAKVRQKAAYDILRIENTCGFTEPYSEIYFERDLIENLQFYIQSDELNRGGKSKSTGMNNETLHVGRKYAVVIATGNFEAEGNEWKNLNNPIDDGKEVARLLQANFGYEVELLIDPTADTIFQVLDSLSKTLKENDQFVCFIAGHGDYDPKFFDDGFLVLRNSLSLKKDPYRRTYLPFTLLGNIIDNLPCNQVMLMVDICFGGAFDQKLVKGERSKTPSYNDVETAMMISEKMNKRTRIVLASGSLNTVPDGYRGKHSPFAAKLISALESKGGDRGVILSTQLYESVQWLPSKPFLGELFGNESGAEFLLIAE
ncbi:MAG: hypothetical protein GC181_14295 [Bacteroidetes bacterium]|nr:hypothetical protein [Bacteroidota bacterium]